MKRGITKVKSVMNTDKQKTKGGYTKVNAVMNTPKYTKRGKAC